MVFGPDREGEKWLRAVRGSCPRRRQFAERLDHEAVLRSYASGGFVETDETSIGCAALGREDHNTALRIRPEVHCELGSAVRTRRGQIPSFAVKFNLVSTLQRLF